MFTVDEEMTEEEYHAYVNQILSTPRGGTILDEMPEYHRHAEPEVQEDMAAREDPREIVGAGELMIDLTPPESSSEERPPPPPGADPPGPPPEDNSNESGSGEGEEEFSYVSSGYTDYRDYDGEEEAEEEGEEEQSGSDDDEYRPNDDEDPPVPPPGVAAGVHSKTATRRLQISKGKGKGDPPEPEDPEDKKPRKPNEKPQKEKEMDEEKPRDEEDQEKGMRTLAHVNHSRMIIEEEAYSMHKKYDGHLKRVTDLIDENQKIMEDIQLRHRNECNRQRRKDLREWLQQVSLLIVNLRAHQHALEIDQHFSERSFEIILMKSKKIVMQLEDLLRLKKVTLTAATNTLQQSMIRMNIMMVGEKDPNQLGKEPKLVDCLLKLQKFIIDLEVFAIKVGKPFGYCRLCNVWCFGQTRNRWRVHEGKLRRAFFTRHPDYEEEIKRRLCRYLFSGQNLSEVDENLNLSLIWMPRVELPTFVEKILVGHKCKLSSRNAHLYRMNHVALGIKQAQPTQQAVVEEPTRANRQENRWRNDPLKKDDLKPKTAIIAEPPAPAAKKPERIIDEGVKEKHSVRDVTGNAQPSKFCSQGRSSLTLETFVQPPPRFPENFLTRQTDLRAQATQSQQDDGVEVDEAMTRRARNIALHGESTTWFCRFKKTPGKIHFFENNTSVELNMPMFREFISSVHVVVNDLLVRKVYTFKPEDVHTIAFTKSKRQPK